MAIYIQIKKTAEDASSVFYSFGPIEKIIGSVMLDKSTGTVDLIEIEEGHNAGWFVSRVRRVLAQHHSSRSYPDETRYVA